MAEKKPIGSATEKPAYGEKGQPEPIAPNRTDAEGVDSSWQPGAREGMDQTRATPHTTPDVTDPMFHHRAMLEKYGDKEGRLPHVLSSNLDVRRGEKIYRIPAGSVVKETDLTDEEFDGALRDGLVREATVSELLASERSAQEAETREKQLAAQKEAIGVKPKKASEDKAPKGAKLVADLEEDAVALKRAAAARAIAASGGK